MDRKTHFIILINFKDFFVNTNGLITTYTRESLHAKDIMNITKDFLCNNSKIS